MSTLREDIDKIKKRLDRFICCFNNNINSTNLSNSDLTQTDVQRIYNINSDESDGELVFINGLVKFKSSTTGGDYGSVGLYDDNGLGLWVYVEGFDKGISVTNDDGETSVKATPKYIEFVSSTEGDFYYTIKVPEDYDNDFTVNLPKNNGTLVVKVNGVAANAAGEINFTVGDAAQFIVNAGGYIEPKPEMGGTGLKLKGFSPQARTIPFGEGVSPELDYTDCTVVLYGVNSDTITLPLVDLHSEHRQQLLNLYFHTDNTQTPLVISFNQSLYYYDSTTLTLGTLAGLDIKEYTLKGVPVQLQLIEDKWYLLNPIN